VKKWIIGTVVAGVAMFVVNLILGAVGINLLSASMAAAFTARSIAVHLFAGAVLATALGWKGASDALGAARAGAIIGVLLGLVGAVGGSGFSFMVLLGAILTGIVVYGVSGAVMMVAVAAMATEGDGD